MVYPCVMRARRNKRPKFNSVSIPERPNETVRFEVDDFGHGDFRTNGISSSARQLLVSCIFRVIRVILIFFSNYSASESSRPPFHFFFYDAQEVYWRWEVCTQGRTRWEKEGKKKIIHKTVHRVLLYLFKLFSHHVSRSLCLWLKSDICPRSRWDWPLEKNVLYFSFFSLNKMNKMSKRAINPCQKYHLRRYDARNY